jgi:hypothetical protein
MTAPRRGASPAGDTDLDEREVDLARWRRAVATLWWIPVAGLVAGAILGVLFSLRGGTDYKASALIALGQPAAPGGALVNGFSTNPRAVEQIVESATAQAEAAGKAGLRPDELRGRISVSEVGLPSGAGATRATPLISLTVVGTHSLSTAAAANALAKIAVQRTTASYVGLRIRTFAASLKSVNVQLATVKRRLAVIEHAASTAKNLDALQQLVIVSQEDNAEQRLGNLIAEQFALQQQRSFAEEVESAKVIVPARAVKASAHSRNSSLVVGAIIGLILGAIGAIVLDSRQTA